MLQVICVGIFDTEIVNNERKGDIYCVVAEKSLGMMALCVAMFCKEGV